MPLTEICNDAYTDPRQRQLFKNIIYVGALSALLDIDPDEIEKLIGEQYKGKEKLLKPNVQGAADGARLRARQPDVPDRPQGEARRRRRQEDLHRGQQRRGAGRACTAAPRSRVVSDHAVVVARRGVRAPLPASSALDPDTGKSRYAIVQAEDELASIGMVIGAGWNGARAFTCTSGPGISLMQEFIGLAYFAEIPAVIIDVQRGGPSTGMPTRTQQSDVLSCAYASHGDTKHVLLFPEDPKECFEIAAQAFDLADRLQTPVFVMTDLDIGMNERLCEPLAWDDAQRYDRGKVMTLRGCSRRARNSAATSTSTATASRTAPIPARTRRAARYFTRGTTKDRYARYSEAGPDYVDNMQRLLRKFETAKTLVPEAGAASRREQPARFGAIYFGSTSPAMHEALDALAAQGIHVDALRVRALPVPGRDRRFRRLAHQGVRGRAEPRRAAEDAARQRAEVESRQPASRSCTTTARRSPRASSSTQIAAACARAQRAAAPEREGRLA